MHFSITLLRSKIKFGKNLKAPKETLKSMPELIKETFCIEKTNVTSNCTTSKWGDDLLKQIADETRTGIKYGTHQPETRSGCLKWLF